MKNSFFLIILLLFITIESAQIRRSAQMHKHKNRHLNDYEEEEYHEEEEHPEEEEHYDEEEHGEEHGEEHHEDDMLHFDDNSDTEHMRNFKRISDDLKVYETEYKECVDSIGDEEFTESRIEQCVGKNFIKVVLDIKYETMKIISRADSKTRQVFVDLCYMEAGTDEHFSSSCDIMERDVLDLLWGGLKFLDLLELNKDKYLIEYGTLPEETFDAIVEHFGDFSTEFFELLDEVDAHKEVTLLRLKTHIDDRTKLIEDEAEEDPEVEPHIRNYKFAIEETVVDDAAHLPAEEDLPHSQIENGEVDQMEMEEEEIRRKRKLKQLKRTPSKKYTRNVIRIRPNPQKRRLPIHKGMTHIVRRKLNTHRVFNDERGYSKINNRGFAGRGGVSNKRRSFIHPGRSTREKRSVLSRISSVSKLGRSTFKNIHGTNFKSRVKRFN